MSSYWYFMLILLLPLLMRRNRNSGEKKWDYQCPSCGHQWDDPPTPRVDKIWMVAFSSFLILILAFAIFMLVDTISDNIYTNDFRVDSECNYESKNWKVLEKDGKFGAFSIDNKKSIRFLGGKPYDNSYYFNHDVAWFTTECKAKGMIVAYLKQNEKEKAEKEFLKGDPK